MTNTTIPLTEADEILTGEERAALERAADTGARAQTWLLALAERVLAGANPAAGGDGLFGLGMVLRRMAGTVTAVLDGIDPSGNGEADLEVQYELTNLIRHHVMEPVGREQLRLPECVALIAIGGLVIDAPNLVLGDLEVLLPELCDAIDEALVLAGGDGSATVLLAAREVTAG
ncbi:hypothetical protein [Kitasatospora griseola]|uniref:hypothetical protein n=1 Tax=Kitasatospora griseola TaxID=2064 RepID=UPI00380DEA8F